MAKSLTDKQYIELWNTFRDNIDRATPVDLNETPIQKEKRIAYLEANPEEWFKYYFPNYYKNEPALFHIKSTKRALNNSEWYEVRAWSRELAKSARTMMEVLYLVLSGKKRNVVLTSSTLDNAERLLLPYKSNLEKNNRIINDYGVQESIGNWQSNEFITRKGVAYRAIGAGQSPRGTRNEEVRPDVLLIDDIDTDEECRNKDRIKQKIKWIEEAFMATRSISNPLLVIVCGNIIAKFCCVTELAKRADHFELINIRDKNGKSTWPQKNSEAQIDRVLSKVSYSAGQKEYFNNPISEGDIFKEITYGRCPKLTSCEIVLVYADPATSNKEKSKSSSKSVVIVGYKNLTYYVYRVWIDNTCNSKFIDWLFGSYEYLKSYDVDTIRIFIENNSLQDPFYEQVIIPIIKERSKAAKYTLPITPDKRKKPDKFDRIEGTLEPLNRFGKIVFNETLKNEPNMQRMEEQMLGVSENSKIMDGPDALEGGVWLIQNRKVKKETTYRSGTRNNNKY